ncbi:hypothetical protein [Micromonospora sp. LOL_024]|uniref:hypothetical protein n=1 Tax=Micromonospora sp. LOL_024 TaxID=3345412 RepID=UPI003A8C0679
MTTVVPPPVDGDRVAAVLRLRPIVHASPVDVGVHLRGARSSFTLGGGPAVWRVWEAVAVALADGTSAGSLLELSSRPDVRLVIATLLEQLQKHDMLVQVPVGWGETGRDDEPPLRIARWLEAVAAQPVAAWKAIRATEIRVDGAGPVADAAVRALRSSGARPGSGGADSPSVALTAAGVTVVAAALGEQGYVAPPSDRGTAVASDIDRRLNLSGDPIGTPPVLGALVGGAAAHRMLCAVARLPDPSVDRFAGTPARTDGHRTVLVACLDPLRAEYHPWLGDPDAPAVAPRERTNLDQALARVRMLTDPHTGVLPVVGLDDLPQVPAGLARCGPAGAAVYGVGVSPAMAQLGAVLGAAERALATPTIDVVVGADLRHADGVLLRRLAHRSGLRGEPVPGERWSASAAARLWWKTLTLRLGVPATLRVEELAGDVFHGELTAAGRLLAWGVESTPTDVAAFCALTAVGRIQSRGHRPPGADDAVVAPCAAVPPPAVPPQTDGSAGAVDRPWRTGAWVWPDEATLGELELHHRLRTLLGTEPVPTGVPAGRLARALAEVGFVIRSVPR